MRAWLLAAALAFGGCASHQLPAEQAHECFMSVLAPRLGDRAESVLAAIMAGGSPAAVLLRHRLTEAEAREVLMGLSECMLAEPVEPPPVDQTVRAAPPAYGRKVL